MRKLGVIGHPVGHSISPAFQQAGLDALGIDARYERYDVPPEGLAAFVDGVRRGEEWLGVNVTIPHKQAVIPLLDDLDPSAARIGAVNTILNRRGALRGYNTDPSGFLRALEGGGVSASGARAVVLGSGGAARAVVAALCGAGAASVVLFGRSHPRARALVRSLEGGCGATALGAGVWESLDAPVALRRTTLLVNTTPVGMRGGGAEGESPVRAEVLHPELAVFDLVYNPLRTPLLLQAEQVGARTIGGLEMLVLQGAEALELWTGRRAPTDIMMTRGREALG